MSTENNLFRDYCKAENSEDEENIIDLQSRLYAEVYYAPSEEQNSNTKTIVNPPTFGTNDKPTSQDDTHKRCQRNAITEGIFIYDDTFSDHDDFYINDSKPCMEILKSTESFKQNDTLSTKPAHSENEFVMSSSGLDNKPTKLAEMLDQYSQKDMKPADNITVKEQTTCHEVTNERVIPEARTACTRSTAVTVKSEVETQDKEETTVGGNNNSNVPLSGADEAYDQISTKTNTDSNVVSNIESQYGVTKEKEIVGDILRKYDFSKPYINKLYLEKYEELEQRLRDEEKEDQQHEIHGNVNEQGSVRDETEIDSRYTVCKKSEKKKERATVSSDDVTIISESESDSEDSILEVPIPPKPKPPIVNLQDSDEDYVTLSSGDEETNMGCLDAMDYGYKLIVDDTQPVTHTQLQNKAHKIHDSSLHNDITAISLQSVSLQVHDEDILLNCTEPQKGASNLNEIKQMSKGVKKEKIQQNLCVEKTKDLGKPLQDSEKNILNIIDKKSRRHAFVNDMHKSDSRLDSDGQSIHGNFSLITTAEESTSLQRDGSSMDNTSNRKRHCENDDGIASNPKQAKYSNKKDDVIQTSTMQQNESNQTGKPESWEAYIFRPMSDKLKAFYTESRGQENFNINEIQSKMSKDPRLWAILDEDLMPSPSRWQRFWNMKCTHCQREGHQRYNCPEPRKPPRCHICGTQGHTETRCPQKMCLTCGKKQGTFRKTCEFCRTLFCNMCQAVGHKSTECPDLWRRFHQTTRNSEINIPENLTDIMKPADLLFCCNCTKRGHDSSTCNEFRWSQHFPTPSFVSNYKDGPKYINAKAAGSHQVDMIPLSRTLDLHVQQPQNKIQTEKCDTKESVIYACGTRALKKKGYVIEQHLNPTQYHLTALLERRAAPHFLVKLLNVARFEVKIYFNEKQKLMLRVRGLETYSKIIYRFALHWLELEEDEKKISMYINLSPNKAEMISLLSSKLGELNKNLQVPKYLWENITRLKKEIAGAKDPKIVSATRKQLHGFQIELLKVYHVQLTKSKTLSQLRVMVENLKRTKNNTLNPQEQMQILLLYNKIFTPHTPANIKNLLNVHNSKQKEQKSGDTAKKTKAANIYEKFLAGLKGCKKSTKQQKQTPSSDEAKKGMIDNPIIETVQPTESTTETSNTYRIETIQLPRTEEAQMSLPNVNTVNQAGMVSTNLIPIPLVESTVVSSEPQCSGSSTLNPNDDDIIEVVHIQSNATESTTEIDDNAQNVSKKPSKKKKSKKAKEKSDKTEQANEKEALSNTEPLVHRAKKVIQEAFAFQLPYMNKAAAEVEKRLGDNGIKAKHIDVLEKLVNLEKHHQKHVNSFYSYLE